MTTAPAKKTYKKSTIIGKNTERSEDKSGHYVDRPAFYAALVERRKIIEETGEKPPVTEFIGECILNIAKGLSMKHNFIGYSFREEMAGDAIIHCLRYIDSFDPKVSNNPFSYFTQTSYYVFLERIREERGEQYVKYALMLDSAALKEVSEQPDQYTQHDIDLSELDTNHIAEFVQKFETTLAPKVTKKQLTKKGTPMKTLDDIGESNKTPEMLAEFVEESGDLIDDIGEDIGLDEDDQ
jgi:hypothetical protein